MALAVCHWCQPETVLHGGPAGEFNGRVHGVRHSDEYQRVLCGLNLRSYWRNEAKQMSLAVCAEII